MFSLGEEDPDVVRLLLYYIYHLSYPVRKSLLASRRLRWLTSTEGQTDGGTGEATDVSSTPTTAPDSADHTSEARLRHREGRGSKRSNRAETISTRFTC